MKKEINVCENCGKESKDYYAEIGWIHVDKMKFEILNGRSKHGSANTERYYSTESHEAELDFCCLKCFYKWMYFDKETENGLKTDYNDKFYDQKFDVS